MLQFILVSAEADQNPAFMKIGGFGRGPGVNQHLRGIDAVCLDANPIDPVAETGKHLATHLPAVQLGRGIGRGGTWHLGADLVDYLACHGMKPPSDWTVAKIGIPGKYLARRLTNCYQNRGFPVGELILLLQENEGAWNRDKPMRFAEIVGSRRASDRTVGRRQEDRAMRGGGWAAGRERRRPVLQTDAAAHSVIMARLAEKPKVQVRPDVAQLYAQAKPQKSAAELRREEFMREAELAHQAAQRAWVFERRTGQKPRTTDIEDAVIVQD